MSDSESEFEAPKITSTQLSPKKVDTMEQLAFQNKFQYKKNVMNINSLLKSKSRSVATREQVSPMIKKKLMDDERDSSYFSSNEASKKSSQRSSHKADSSSDSSDSESSKANGTSSEDEETSSGEKKSGSSSSNSSSDASVKKQKKMTKTVKKTHLTADNKDTSSSSSEESFSEDDKTQKKKQFHSPKDRIKGTLQQKKKEETSSSGSSQSSSEDDDEKKSASEESSESGNDQEEDKRKGTQKDSETGSESSSTSKSSEATGSSAESSEDDETPPGKSKKVAMNAAASDGDSDSTCSDGDDSKLNQTNYVPTKRTEKLLDDYVQMYNLHQAKLDDAFDLAKLSEDDEIFFVSVAKSINPSLLVKSKLTPDGKQLIRLQCGDCAVEFDKHDKEKLCLLGKLGAGWGVKHVHTSGGFTINVDQKIATERTMSPTVKPKEKVPFPEDKLRVRHPLFGRHYQQKIALEEDVAKKLDDLISGMIGETRNAKDDARGVKAKKRKKGEEKMDIAGILSAFGDASKDKTKKDAKKKRKKESRSKSPQSEVGADAKVRKSLSPVKQVNACIGYLHTPKKKQDKHGAVDDASTKVTAFGKLKNKQTSKLLSSTMNSPSLQKAAFFDPNESFIPPAAMKKKATATPTKCLLNFEINDDSIMKLIDEVKDNSEHSGKSKDTKKKKDKSKSQRGEEKRKRKHSKTENVDEEIDAETTMKSIDEAVLDKEHSAKKQDKKKKKAKSQTEKDESKSEKRKRRHSATVAESEMAEKKKEKTSQIKKRRPTMI